METVRKYLVSKMICWRRRNQVPHWWWPAAFDMKDGEVTIEDFADSEATGEEAGLANWA
jgi:hypothetical protein